MLLQVFSIFDKFKNIISDTAGFKTEKGTFEQIPILKQTKVHLSFLGTGAEDVHLGLSTGTNSYYSSLLPNTSRKNVKNLTDTREEAVTTAVCLFRAPLLWTESTETLLVIALVL